MDLDGMALASDFDGTLYFFREDPPYHAEDLAAVRAFRAAGGKFGVCTGRSLRGILDVPEGAVCCDFYILDSGALVLDGKRKVLARSTVDKEVLCEIYERYRDSAQIIFHANDTVYSFYRDMPMQTYISSFDELSGNLYGLSFGTNSPLTAEKLTADVNARYGGAVTAFENVRNVDIVAGGCSKGRALAQVRKALSLKTVGGVGDSYNDLPLLRAADVSFTFPTAPEPVRREADHVVQSVAEVLDVLKEKCGSEGNAD